MRLIDADALPRHGGRGGIVHWKDIEESPTIIFEKRGRCLNKARYFYCSECCYAVADVFEGAKTDDKKVYLFEKGKTWNYCPNCGAKMEESNETD